MSISTSVVCMKREKGEIIQNCEIYIGRQVSKGGWNLTKSIFANPYIVGQVCIAKHSGEIIRVIDHNDAVIKYWNMIVGGKVDLKSYDDIKTIRKAIPNLKGKILGCWCKKKGQEICHGDVLAYVADNWEGKVDSSGAMIININFEKMSPALRKLFELN